MSRQPWIEVGDYALHWGGTCGPPSLVMASAREALACIPLITADGEGNDSTSALTIGVHLHAFYLDACPAILATLRRSIPRCQLLITTDSTTKQASIEALLRQSLEGAGGATVWSTQVLVTPNQGRNVLPLLRYGWTELHRCDLVLHLHTKQSPHQSFGTEWGRDLISTLAGTATAVKSVMAAFESEPQLGMVIPKPSEAIRPYLHWGANFECASWICSALWPDRFLSLEAPLAFPAGMMLWFRPNAFAPLIAAESVLRNPPEEPLLDDGTSLHALERLTLHACEVAGYSWRYVNSPGQPTAAAHTTEAPSETQPWLSVWQPQPIVYRAGVAALAQRHRVLQTQHAEMLAMQEQARDEHAALKEQLAAAEASNNHLSDELRALRHSLSWRLTGPLRRLSRLLRQISR